MTNTTDTPPAGPAASTLAERVATARAGETVRFDAVTVEADPEAYVSFAFDLPVRDDQGHRIPILDDEGAQVQGPDGPMWRTEPGPVLHAYKPTPYAAAMFTRIARGSAARAATGVRPSDVLTPEEVQDFQRMVIAFLEDGVLPESRRWLERQLMSPTSGLTIMSLFKPYATIVASVAGGPTQP